VTFAFYFLAVFSRFCVRRSIVIALLAFGIAGIRAEEGAAIPVGVAEVDITPDYPVRLNGFGFRRTESEGVTIKVWAKAMAFADVKEGPAVLIVTDNLCVPGDITEEVARRLGPKIGLKPERLTITATHTHTAPMLRNSCPTIFGVPIPPEHQAHIDQYTREFTDKLEQVALAAVKDIRPARLSWGIGNVGFSVNRRTKGGPVDHDFPMLLVRDLDGKVRAVYFSYACHCVTLSNNKISGDWSGFAKEAVEQLFPGAIALASVGCGGDSNPNTGVTGDNVQACRNQGLEIANEVKGLAAGPLTPLPTAPVIHYSRLDLPLDKPRTRAEWEERAKRNDAVGYHAKVNLARLDRGETLPTKLNYPIQTWVFGNKLAMVFLPGEMVVDYSLRLKREFDRNRIWVNAYANNARCYIPSERVLKEGGYEGGEAMIYYDVPQRFAPGLEQKIIDAVSAEIPSSFAAPKGTEGTAPLSPADSIGAMRVKRGFTVELAASEPLIADPVAIDWGADGKLWVCEMNDYPTGINQDWQPGGRVKFLEDTDGDGHYDKATLFIDPLPFPTGVTAWGRGVYICAAPDIIYAEDTDGDGKADKIEKVYTGFPTDNYQARVNSLSLGLDNWIYGADGLLGGVIRPGSARESAGMHEVNIRNHDFRFDPATRVFEIVSGLTQQGRVRDDWGNWFGCNNSQLLLNFPIPERYLRRNPHIPAPQAAKYLPSDPDSNRVYPVSRLLERFNDPGSANHVTSGCGLGIYRDTLLGGEFYGNAFTCEPVHNLVHREVITQDETSLSSHRAEEESDSEFLASTDNWFRPVQARTGPDGALYIVDMYRFLIEHPRWIPAARLAQLDVRAGSDKGRIYRVRPSAHVPRAVRDLTKLSAAELAAALDSPNGTERDRVHIELLQRRDSECVDPLRKLAEGASMPQVRVQALSVLSGIGRLEPAQIRAALRDADPHVRQQAIRFAERFLPQSSDVTDGLLAAVVQLIHDPSPLVIQQLAFSLGESRDPRAAKALAEIAERSIENPNLRVAILSSATGHSGEVLDAVMSVDKKTPGRSEWVNGLVATAAASKNPRLLDRALSAVLPAGNAALSEGNLAALGSLLDGLERNDFNLANYLDTDSGKVQKPRLNAALAEARRLALNQGAPEQAREAALKLLGRGSDPREDVAVLCQIASESSSDGLRGAALASLRRQRGTDVPERLLSNWAQTSPGVRGLIVDLLLGREEWSRSLLEAIKSDKVSANQLSLNERQRLTSSANGEIRKLAREVLPEQPASGRAEVIQRYQSALALAGNSTAGAEVFSKNCSVCHLVRGIGHDVGPDLAALASKDSAYFMKNILDPNAVIEPRFINYQIDLKDDRTLNGVIKGETGNSLTLVAGNGVSETVLRSDIKDIRASAISLMPEGLEQGITPEQMADLLAFLRFDSAAKKIAGNNPQLIAPASNGSLVLPASRAEIHGGDITFEEPFQNIGMWHGENDYAAWNIRVERPGTFAVYIDYACAASAAGSPFMLTAAGQQLAGTVAATGPDWSEYKQLKIGELHLDAGQHHVTLAPDGNVREALLDLRAIAFAPSGVKLSWPRRAAPDDHVLRDAPSVARFILDPNSSDAAREAAINANPQFAAQLITEMSRGLSVSEEGRAEEYRRIPWIWRVAIACGKRNNPAQIKDVLNAALPAAGKPLADWQVVVLGGGIINGLSQRALAPAARLADIIGSDDSLRERWHSALTESSKMTADEKTPPGTRYDAMRMLGTESWEKRGAELTPYFAKETNPELQMGAISALADMRSPDANTALIKSLPGLQSANIDLAINALFQNDESTRQLLEAIASKKVNPTLLNRDRINQLLQHRNSAIQQYAERLFH
jgi:putative membrane-bound dehydrogenase-like protein